MKKLVLLLVFISCSLQAQYQISGQLQPANNYSWVILYKIEGARQIFVKNEKINNGKFNFTLPANAKMGTYRVTYKTEGNGFADFLFNKEDVAFIFNPEKAEETIQFTKSAENKLYQEYIKTVSVAQAKTDSLQVAYIKNPQVQTEKLYNAQLSIIAALQKKYLEKSKGKMVYHFIKATNRYNSPTIAKNGQDYLKAIVAHFFDTIDFNNQALYNSAFIVDRILDYVFYMNYSEDPTKQFELHKNAVKVVVNKATDITFKKDIIEFLINQFAKYQYTNFSDYLVKEYYKKLPANKKNKEFLSTYYQNTAVSIGRKAPEITWTENGKSYKLSTINDAQNYVLVFWSTGCGHCLREIPLLYKHTENSKNVKVIAFSLETEATDWNKHIKKYPKWHNLIGLKKWENPIARTYQIYSTPTYIVLGSDKKIIAKPNTLEEVKKIVDYLDK
ncbi:MAG: TlpA family protein disulfide reductase [Flavobacteriaceae bacterium]|nr:TlpA family protein disulfide reductase [Flavobacteriaceae bacterium]